MRKPEPAWDESIWIWQKAGWPNFTWQQDRLSAALRSCTASQGRLLGMIGAAGGDAAIQNSLDTMLQNIITSSAIEGETLNVGSVRSSLARRFGLGEEGRTCAQSEGLAELMIDATRGYNQALTIERLFEWQSWIFPNGDPSFRRPPINIGALRGEEAMQVVSGAGRSRRVHYEAPPRSGLEEQLDVFLKWFESTRSSRDLDPILRAGIAHLWFVTLHPFDDGNGRLTRALTDLALAQSDPKAVGFYAMAPSILKRREGEGGYYSILESTQRGDADITAWLEWFLETLQMSLDNAIAQIDKELSKARFWQVNRDQYLSAQQIKVLNRLLDGGENGFEGGISAEKYGKTTGVSKATATRHLGDLLEKGLIARLPGGGRNTRYQVVADHIDLCVEQDLQPFDRLNP